MACQSWQKIAQMAPNLVEWKDMAGLLLLKFWPRVNQGVMFQNTNQGDTAPECYLLFCRIATYHCMSFTKCQMRNTTCNLLFSAFWWAKQISNFNFEYSIIFEFQRLLTPLWYRVYILEMVSEIPRQIHLVFHVLFKVFITISHHYLFTWSFLHS